MQNDFSLYMLYQMGQTLYSALISVQDFFFQHRTFDLMDMSNPLASKLYDALGLSVVVYEGSLANLIIGYGLPTLCLVILAKWIIEFIP